MIGDADKKKLRTYIETTANLNIDTRLNNGGGCGEFVQQLIESGTEKQIDNWNNIFQTGKNMYNQGLDITLIDSVDKLIAGSILCVIKTVDNTMRHYALCVAGWELRDDTGRVFNVLGLNGFMDSLHNFDVYHGATSSIITGAHFYNNGYFKYDKYDNYDNYDKIELNRTSKLIQIDYNLLVIRSDNLNKDKGCCIVQ